jgi:hypothetical protein
VSDAEKNKVSAAIKLNPKIGERLLVTLSADTDPAFSKELHKSLTQLVGAGNFMIVVGDVSFKKVQVVEE